MNLKEKLRKIAMKIRPSEKKKSKEKKFIEKILNSLKKELPSCDIVLAGSFAKDTFLEGDNDIDIFVLFNHKIEKEAMPGILKGAVESAFPNIKYEMSYAEHPYLRMYVGKKRVDLVPAYKLEHGRHFVLRTAVDRTQLHTEYINNNLKESQKDEVRLLKKFLKSNYLYGAEIKRKGFSGYLCEVLIIHYKTFLNLVREAANWKEKTVICVEGKVDGKKFNNPLVVIDPVDKNRNIAASVGIESYCRFILLCRKFLNSKNPERFFTNSVSKAKVKNFIKKRYLFAFVLKKPKVVDDILWGQIHKFMNSAELFLKERGFTLIGKWAAFENGGIVMLFDFLNKKIEERTLKKGPPIYMLKNFQKFAEKHDNKVLLSSTIYAVKENEKTEAKEILKELRKIPSPSHLKGIKRAKIYEIDGRMLKKFEKTIMEYVKVQEVL